MAHRRAPSPSPSQRCAPGPSLAHGGEWGFDRAASFLLAAILLSIMLAACARTLPPAPVVAGGQSAASGTTSAPTRPTVAAARPAVAHPDKVTVQSGETLYAISRRYDVPVRSLIEANGLAPPYSLGSGRTLSVPQVRQHVVQTGDTLYSISRLYGVDTSTLAHANGIDAPYVVRVGQALVLPAPVETAGTRTAAPVIQATAPAPAYAAPAAPAIEPPPLPAADIAAATPPAAAAPPPPAPDEKTAAVALPPLAPPPRNTGRTFLWPVHGRVIGQYGGGASGTHNDGINIAAPEGTMVMAADAGTVAYAGNELRGYGNLVLIKHADGWMTAYAHNAALLVKRGDRVRRGQAIARVGATGAVGEPQLHFEIRHGARALDPGEYLPPEGATAAKG
jgi:murein DD-endopeptidase MepM/ murein hydrolase activator NlpD